MNYEQWTNRQIAMAVAMTLEGVDFNENAEPLFAVDCFYGGIDDHGCMVVWTGKFDGEYFDPCNNPADAWPLIVENNINLEWFIDNEGVYASASVSIEFIGTTSFLSDHENPLRAAMICFLKMKDGN